MFHVGLETRVRFLSQSSPNLAKHSLTHAGPLATSETKPQLREMCAPRLPLLWEALPSCRHTQRALSCQTVQIKLWLQEGGCNVLLCFSGPEMTPKRIWHSWGYGGVESTTNKHNHRPTKQFHNRKLWQKQMSKLRY